MTVTIDNTPRRLRYHGIGAPWCAQPRRREFVRCELARPRFLAQSRSPSSDPVWTG